MQSSKPEPNHTEQYKELSLDTKPIVLLYNNSKLRQILSNALNYEQVIKNDDGLNRDYRGLAELLDLPANELRNLDRNPDPMLIILTYLSSLNLFYLNNNNQINNQSAANRNADEKIVNQYCTIELLVQSLEKLDRYDVIDDLLDELRLNPIEKQKSPLNKPTMELVKYDAYVSYVDSDLPFVKSLCDYLESSAINLRLYLRDRDSRMGSLEYAEFTELMEKQCNRLLVILSPDFLESPECEFQTKFTFSLQIHERSRKLIPIIYRACKLPYSIQCLSKIDLTKYSTPEWTINKLILSLSNNSDQNMKVRNFPPFRFNYGELPSLSIRSLNSSDCSSMKDNVTTNRSIDNSKANNLAVNKSAPVENKKIKVALNDNSSLKNPTTKLTSLNDKSNLLNLKLNTTKSVLSTQTFSSEDTEALINKQKNFKLLSKLWKKIKDIK